MYQKIFSTVNGTKEAFSYCIKNKKILEFVSALIGSANFITDSPLDVVPSGKNTTGSEEQKFFEK